MRIFLNNLKIKSEPSDFSFDQEISPSSETSVILDVLQTGSGRPKLIIGHKNGTAVYTVMKINRLQKKKNDKNVFSIQIKCVNQSNSENKCKSSFTVTCIDETIFEWIKTNRSKEKSWQFRKDKKLSAADFEPLEISEVVHGCQFSYNQSFAEMKYFDRIRRKRAENPYMKAW